MARGKKGAPRGRGGGRGSSRGGGRGRGGRGSYNNDRDDMNTGTDFVPFAGAPSIRPRPQGNSMRFEALSTQMHESHWESGQKLRHNKVTFVSAGGVEESAAKANEEAMADMSLKEVSTSLPMDVDAKQPSKEQKKTKSFSPVPKDDIADEETEEATVPEVLEEILAEALSTDTPVDEPMADEAADDSAEEDTFIIDTTGAQPFTTGLPAPRIRSPSPTLSDSSEEVILFGGRDNTGKAIRRSSPMRTAKSFQRTITDEVVKNVLARPPATVSPENVNAKATTPAGSKSTYKKPSIAPATEAEEEAASVLTESKSPHPQTSHQKTSGGPGKSKKQSLEDAMVADYIENLKEQGLDPSAPYNQRELGGTDSEDWAAEEEDNILEEREDGWTKSDLSDFDNMSTSDGNIGIVEEILSKRDRASGVQYLVVWEGTSMDEARWVPELVLTDVRAKEMIDNFLAEEQLIAEAFCTDSESDSDEDDDLLDGPDDDDSQDDDEELKAERALERKIERMSDEQIARLLAKQEELGMDSTNLMLFDGLDGDEGEDEDDDDGFMPASASRRRPRSNKAAPKRAKGEFPSATLTADAYDGFDVMDFERPSLSVKKRTKARKGKPVFDISDSELERSMEDAWDMDRQKKTAKKREREELRAAGLLGSGSRPGKPDLKQKYKEGMNIDGIKEEMRTFLMGTNTTLSLPPMDKTYRKVVHEIANAFNLKSKSAGSGTSRFPILYRTQRTILYTEYAFSKVESRVARFMPRSDVRGKRTAGGSSRGGFGGGGGGRGGGGGGGGYRDGDVVGESAPELGVQNKGFAMLQKMGWSSGTALGALNNKGILQPVSHVVKTSKAGLG